MVNIEYNKNFNLNFIFNVIDNLYFTLVDLVQQEGRMIFASELDEII